MLQLILAYCLITKSIDSKKITDGVSSDIYGTSKPLKMNTVLKEP